MCCCGVALTNPDLWSTYEGVNMYIKKRTNNIKIFIVRTYSCKLCDFSVMCCIISSVWMAGNSWCLHEGLNVKSNIHQRETISVCLSGWPLHCFLFFVYLFVFSCFVVIRCELVLWCCPIKHPWEKKSVLSLWFVWKKMFMINSTKEWQVSNY